MTHPSRLACALLLSALTACGGKSFEANDEPNTGGVDQGGSGQGGNGSAGASRGGVSNYAGTASYAGTTSYAGTGAGGSGPVCDVFNDASGTQVSVAIFNQTSAPIYLGQDMVNCGVAPLFGVADAAGPLAFPSGCETTCQQLRTSGPIGCPSICAFPSATALQPGDVLYTSWNGLFMGERLLPDVCASADYGNTCLQRLQVQPGQFTFSSVAGRSLDCSETRGGPCQACMPDGQGGCVTPGSLIGGPFLKAATSVLLGPSYGVYGSAPPLPANPNGPMPNPGGNGAIALQTVEIVFTE